MNKALEPKSNNIDTKASVQSLNILRVRGGLPSGASLELWPDLSDKEIVYKDDNGDVSLIDAIEIAVPGSGKGGMNRKLTISLRSTEGRIFSKTPLSSSPSTDKGSVEIENSIFCTKLSDCRTKMDLGFQFSKPTYDEYGSEIFSEIYFLTCAKDDDADTRIHRIDPSVVIIRG